MSRSNRNPPWWTSTVVYQIYPRSFFDSNGDGIGDLQGIIQKLDYLQDLGVETLWISPFYSSPQADFGYDISDYRGISLEYGTMDDCDAIIEAVHLKGMRIVLDLVLNHTSDQHPWFLESRASRTNPKRDWYVWRDGRTPGGKKPPNNWHNMIAGRGWHYDATTDQWYWAQFLPFQPDLNYRNPEVRAAILDTVRFWMDKGADGFRLDIINALYEDAEFRDNSFAWKLLPSPEDPGCLFQSHDRTLNHPDTLEFMKELRRVVDQHDGRDRFLVGEVVTPVEVARKFCGDNDGLHLVFLFKSLDAPMRASVFRDLITLYEAEFPAPLIPTWVFANHDRMRRISRYGGDPEIAKLNAALQLTARGVPFLYQGEEIGMLQHSLPIRDSLDALAKPFRKVPQFIIDLIFKKIVGETINRDECRTPMQWEAGRNAGFCASDAKPWLPIGPEHAQRNVETESDDKDSLLECYRRFLRARRDTLALNSGTLALLTDSAIPEQVLAYSRTTYDETDEARVYLNFAATPAMLPELPPEARLLVSTNADRRIDDTEPVLLKPWEGIVVVPQ